jgi:hypothetical protein
MAKVIDTAYVISKYLDTRRDLPPEFKRVCLTLYRGQVYTMTKWEKIINRRLTRPASK